MKIGTAVRRPWVPFHGAEFFAKANLISDAQAIALLRLIWSYWENGGLPDDDQKLARIARMTPKQWNKSRAAISEFFGDQWTSERLDLELAKIIDLSNKNREKAELGHSLRRARAEPAQEPQQDHTHLHVHQSGVVVVDADARETIEEAFNEEARTLGLEFLLAAGFENPTSTEGWEVLADHTKAWINAGYPRSMIIAETRMIAHKGGHRKPLGYFDTTFRRVHDRNNLELAALAAMR
ncbi:DUF1376 domain-containing protein [Bradyrhizobium erythrophlei]|uniref:Uncharacterized conserved protein YdaU, DUF1376 family n=1 Tax=Bradyrhizobium erythrophlei TaxID=1437360 RepID=A0A1M7UVG0_9BRAD|nr:DUF1376 domain-containing protein [Bradyrhizobium erythrophlei]SHN86928.1 Uncharacterized conserved protein YdaU, DUF1376 family [Bradyrhizobium erythrophlei]